MKSRVWLTLIAVSVCFCGCSTFSFLFPPTVPPNALVLPTNIKQADWSPPTAQQTDYSTQSLLYAEFGSRFFNRGDMAASRQFFGLALKYDETNAKALFGLAMTDWQDGNYSEAVSNFSAIRPSEKKVYPYDIDYYAAAKMFLGSLPLSGRVIYLSRNDRVSVDENVVVINRGEVNGIRVGMHFKISRMGNPIRDFESLQVLGTQKTLIAHVTVVELSKLSAICKVDDSEANYFIQINDLVESDFGATK